MARKAAYRKKRLNLGALAAVAIAVLIFVVVGINSMNLKTKLESYNAKKAQLETQLADEEQRQTEIEEFEKYTQTKKYIEQVAKDKLGLVYDGETIFKDEGSK